MFECICFFVVDIPGQPTSRMTSKPDL